MALNLYDLLDDHSLAVEATMRRFIPEGSIIHLSGDDPDCPTLCAVFDDAFGGKLMTGINKSQSKYVCRVSLPLLASLVEYLPSQVVRHRYYSYDCDPLMCELSVPANPLPFPQFVRFNNGSDHALSLVECADGHGFDLATAEGKVLHCGLDNQTVFWFARYMTVERLNSST